MPRVAPVTSVTVMSPRSGAPRAEQVGRGVDAAPSIRDSWHYFISQACIPQNETVKVYHVGITVSDLAAARRFYLEGLGCEEVAAQRSTAPYLSMTGYDGVAIDMAFARVPGTDVVLELQEYQELPEKSAPRSEGTSRPGSSHLCFAVDDLDATLARLERYGARRVTDPVEVDRGINAGARAVYVRDPDGFTLELYQR
jgi:glyoxylase I family protein